MDISRRDRLIERPEMLAVAIFEETEETTECAGGCGTVIPVDDDNYSSGDCRGCGRIIGEWGHHCDDCFPRCYNPACQ
jgi:hypothetical protein